jgi:parallel beta-helix repeat protein
MMRSKSALLAAAVTVLGGAGMIATGPAQAEPAGCAPAGSTGLTAAVVATAGQHVSGPIDAHGCDLGVYVGPAASGAAVTGATVTGANDHGIFVQDASGVVIAHNTVTGNGVQRHSSIPEDKAVELSGTSGSLVVGNHVFGNDGGGIGLSDDGPLDPGAPVGNPGALRASTGNQIVGNTVSGNLNDCGIVVTAKNHGTGAVGNVVADNVLTDVPGTFPPALGSIVLAGLGIDHTQVVNNVIHGSFMPGIILHSSRPDTQVNDSVIANNTLSADDWGQVNGPDARVAIILATASQPAGELDHTLLAGNRISADEDYGIYQIGTTGTLIAADRANHAAVPVFGP